MELVSFNTELMCHNDFTYRRTYSYAMKCYCTFITKGAALYEDSFEEGITLYFYTYDTAMIFLATQRKRFALTIIAHATCNGMTRDKYKLYQHIS